MISFVVPIYNNKETLPLLVQKLVEYTWKQKFAWEIIIVEDKSTDGSIEVIEYLASLYPQLKIYFNEASLGFYLSAIEGINYSEGSILGLLDASLSHAIEYIPYLLHPILSGKAEITVGSRFKIGSITEMSFMSRILHEAMNRLILNRLIPLSDPLSNFLFAKRGVLSGINYSVFGFSLGLEVFIKGNYQTIQECAYHYIADKGSSDLLSLNKIPLLLKQINLLKKYQASIKNK